MPDRPRRLPSLALWIFLGGLAQPAEPAGIPDHLPDQYRAWLLEAELLLSKKERKAFLSLDKDYQRDGFIARFWQARDPFPQTEENEFKDMWYGRIDFARENYGTLDDGRSKILLLNGPPGEVNDRHVCARIFLPMDLWYYDGSDQDASKFALIFFQRKPNQPFDLWYPSRGIHGLLHESDTEFWQHCPWTFKAFLDNPYNEATLAAKIEEQMRCFLEQVDQRCGIDADELRRIMSIVTAGKGLQYLLTTTRIESRLPARNEEWLATFHAQSTELPAGAEQFGAGLEVLYPGRRGQRTVVQGVVSVRRSDVLTQELAGRETYNFRLSGEILRTGELFESFRYRYEVAAEQERGDSIPILFQRLLRPGTYELVLKLEDLASRRFFRHTEALTVPKLDAAPADEPADPETARILAEATQALSDRKSLLEIVPPEGDLQVGMVRFEAVSQGYELAKVTFLLDGEVVLSKRREPYSIEMDLGEIPRVRTVGVVGFDAEGREVARDEIEVNTGKNRFAVHLREPKPGTTYRHSLLARAEVEVPDHASLERLELYLNDRRVATLYQPPFQQSIVLDRVAAMSFVRATAYLDDGNSTEDVVFVNSPDFLDEVDVHLVELYAAVVDGNRRPVLGLEMADFTVAEDGVEQQVLRFEDVHDLPIYAGILFDTSASMEKNLGQARIAALKFFQQIISPKDRAAVVTFNNRPRLVARFTNEIDALATEMAGTRAEGSTALWDSVIFTLHYFNGIKGQRAILLLSDGKDEISKFTFKEALTYAQTAGVTFYTVGLGLGKAALDTRHKLTRLAESTGGRGYFVQDVGELEAIYAEIQRELRSKYLLTYQSSNTSGSDEFRTIAVRVARPGVEVKTLPGYYP